MDKIKIGDIITTYYAGYWKVIQIEDRFFDPINSQYYNSSYAKKDDDKYEPIIHSIQLMDGKFNVKKGKKIEFCSGYFCKKVNIEEMKLKAKQDYDELIINIEKLRKIIE